MVKAHGIAGFSGWHLAQKLFREGHAGLHVQHSLHTACAGKALAHLHDEVGQLDQLHQDLVHVVHQSNDVAGGHAAHIDLNAAHVQQRHDGNVDEHIGQRVHQGGNVAHMQLHPGQQVVGVLKALHLAGFLIKGAHDTHTGQVLAGQAQHAVQTVLHRFIQGPRGCHDAEHHHAQQRDGDNKDQRGPGVDRKGHDHGTDDHERAAQEQAQKQVQAVLHLIHVAGHAGDEGAGAQRVHLGKAQGLDMRKQGMAQGCGIAHRCLCGKILRRQAADKADEGQQQQKSAPHKDIVKIVGGNADVHDVRHHQRHEQVERSFQHLEKGSKRSHALVALQVAQHLVQGGFPSFCTLLNKTILL